jgi:hypothetical protein
MTWPTDSERAHRLAVMAAGVAAALLTVVMTASAPAAAGAATATASPWSVEASPNPAGALGAGLSGVSCWEVGACVAVGSSTWPSGQQVPNQKVLVERLADGTWSLASAPTVTGAVSSWLNAVSCPAADFCAAVGGVQHGRPHPTPALAEIWNGTAWSASVPPIPAGGSLPTLYAVSCAAAGECIAVGNFVDKAGAYVPLADQLVGSTWSVLPAPIPPRGESPSSEFTGVDCLPSTSASAAADDVCEVVGDVSYNDTLQAVFAYGLNGTTWTYQPQVNPGPDPGNSDAAVSCSALDACTSVGSVAIIGQVSLAEFWDGSAWVRQATPPPGPKRPDSTLDDVSCDGGASCVAVGESWRVDDENGHLVDPRVMGEVWNGTAWSPSRPVVPTGTASAGLAAISCPSPGSCVAVGTASTTTVASTLVEQYQG